MGSYRFLEHTADVLFEAYGETFQDALESAAAAMFEVMCHTERIEGKKKFEVEERADRLENLTVFVLSTILAECEIKQVLPKRFEVRGFEEKDGEYVLNGVVWGDEWDNNKVKTDVKAVTHHLLEVERKKRVRIRVLLDI